jgi:hypothetical protein
MFVKFEKLNSNKVNPDPRAIQYRHPKYCVALGQYLKPMEHRIYRLKGDGKVLPRSRVIGKGLSQTQRARLLESKMSEFRNPVVLSLDASRFDKHVSYELLLIEHMFYLGMCNDPLFRMLLSWQLKNYGVSSRNIRYVAHGKRMSGDMNTALGNCVLMILMVSTIMFGFFYDILDDGDDCLLIVEEKDLQWCLDNLPAEFLEFGMVLKIEHVARIIEHVEWCQCNPVRVGNHYKFIRDPHKVMSTALGGSKYFTSAGARRKLVNTIGMSELILNLGVPVLQEYALALMRNADTDQHLRLDEVDATYYRVHRELKALNLKQLCKVNPTPISDASRTSFALAFGMCIQDQLELEQFFKSWCFDIDSQEDMVSDVCVPTWTVYRRYTPDLYSLWE